MMKVNPTILYKRCARNPRYYTFQINISNITPVAQITFYCRPKSCRLRKNPGGKNNKRVMTYRHIKAQLTYTSDRVQFSL